MTAPVYTDMSGLRSFVASDNVGEGEKLREAARQFASVFTNMMLKSMRDASLGEGALDSDQSKLYQDLFDKQISLELTKGDHSGITELLVRQLSGQTAPAIDAPNAGDKQSAAKASVYQTVQFDGGRGRHLQINDDAVVYRNALESSPQTQDRNLEADKAL